MLLFNRVLLTFVYLEGDKYPTGGRSNISPTRTMSKQTRPKMSLTTSFISLLTLLWSCHVAGDLSQGMLFPRETETRQVKFLDGMWDFRADISFVGFEEMWYSLPLAEVNVLH